MSSSLLLYSPSPSFSSFDATSVILRFSDGLSCLTTPTRPSMYYPSIMSQIYEDRTFCEHLNVLHPADQTDLYRFKVCLEVVGAHARHIVSLPSSSPSHTPAPTPSR